MIEENEILEMLREAGALKQGHFKLASGRHSGHYVQCALLAQYPDKLDRLIRSRVNELNALGEINSVFFPAIGAMAVGQQVGLALEKRSIFCERNQDNQMELRRAFELHEGENLLLVEDVVTTGSTLLEVKKIEEAAKANILGVFCIINRSGKPTWEGLPLLSVIDLTFPTYAPDEVPEALAAIPVYRPGTKQV